MGRGILQVGGRTRLGIRGRVEETLQVELREETGTLENHNSNAPLTYTYWPVIKREFSAI